MAVVFLAVATVACASGGSRTASGNRDILTRQELEQYHSQDAYTVIQRLRRSWLNTRSTGSVLDPDNLGSESQVQVYVDGVRAANGVDDLRSLDVGQIVEIRHIDGREATMAYGTDHGAGAILVTTGIS